jgi:hypothetical protein
MFKARISTAVSHSLSRNYAVRAEMSPYIHIFIYINKSEAALETRKHGRKGSSRWPRGTPPYLQMLALTS